MLAFKNCSILCKLIALLLNIQSLYCLKCFFSLLIGFFLSVEQWLCNVASCTKSWPQLSGFFLQMRWGCRADGKKETMSATARNN